MLYELAQRTDVAVADVLVAARKIDARTGFTLDRSEPHHSFEHDLVGEYWSRDL